MSPGVLPFLLLGACRHLPPAGLPGTAALGPDEVALLAAGAVGEPLPVVLRDAPGGEAGLRRAAAGVDPSDPALARLEERMRATLLAQQGVGLAAPQVGLARRVVLVERQDRAEPGGAAPVDLLLNPRLTWRSEALVLGWEGCLSVPGWRGEVARAERVRVAWERLDGPPAEEEVGGWTARILQHEIDHLDGVLYVDRVAGALVDEATYQERKRAAEAGSTPTPP